MAMSGGRDDGSPMMDMNTTPLIDVMLVLLIMFIITIPPQTHAVKVDLPINDPNAVKPPVDPQKNTVFIDPTGTVTWNGTIAPRAPGSTLTTRRWPSPSPRSSSRTVTSIRTR